jgi:protein SCO1
MGVKVGRNRSIMIKLCISILLLVGCFFTYWLWPKDELPVLDQAKPFQLKSINGVDYKSDNGKVKLLTFFYTKCPDICPLTMVDFKDLQVLLQEEDLFGNEVELVAITLDPENDTVPVIATYAKAFDANNVGWKFLRGSPEQTKQIADSYHMKYQKVQGDFFTHNTTMFLIDQDNQIRGMYDMANQKSPVQKEEILLAMKKLTENR